MKKVLLPALLLILASPVFSQDFKAMVAANSERTFLAAPAFGNAEPTVFEGNVSVGKFFKLSQTLILQPQFKTVIRMLRKPSCPIYTPSYMPSFALHKLLKPASYVSVMFGHHSNGQDDPFYNENGEINTHTGNFSTNYLKATLTKKIRRAYLAAGIEQHVNIDRSKELTNKYGFLRAHVSCQSEETDLSQLLRKIKENNFVQVSWNSAWILDNMISVKALNAYKRLITSLTLSYKPARLGGVTVFYQYFRGQDYYNIHFDRVLSFSRVGLSLDLNK